MMRLRAAWLQLPEVIEPVKSDHKKAIGRRLKRLRFAEGYASPGEWAHRRKVPLSSWLSWESGAREIPSSQVIKLCADYGYTTDYVYRGLEHTLPGHVRSKLDRAPAENDLPPPKITRQARKQA